jgi:hypothetical protein
MISQHQLKDHLSGFNNLGRLRFDDHAFSRLDNAGSDQGAGTLDLHYADTTTAVSRFVFILTKCRYKDIGSQGGFKQRRTLWDRDRLAIYG